jgi:hypothetical protein
MGDLKVAKLGATWRYVNIPNVWPYFAGIFPEI